MKVLLFVPGFYEDIKSRNYASVLSLFEEHQYKCIFVPIDWKRSTLEDWLKQLNGVYAKYPRENVALAGFSFGAMTAFMAAVKRVPGELWLFSLSPYFAEDLKEVELRRVKFTGKRRMAVFRRFSFEEHVKNIACSTHIIFGSEEPDELIARCKQAHNLIKCSTVEVAWGVSHDVADERYRRAIEWTINKTKM